VPRRQLRRIGPRRKFTWESGIIGGIDTVVADSVVAGWLRPPANSLDTSWSTPQRVEPDATLTRSRIVVSYGTNNGGAQVQRAFNIGFGLIAWDGVTDDPLDLAPLLPHPVLDGGQDWIWRFAAPSILDNTALANNATDLDAYQSMAQRKLSGGVGLLFCFGFTEITGIGPATLNFTVSVDARFLLKLP